MNPQKIKEEKIDNIRFQQDGATCHTADDIIDVLRPVFEAMRYDTVVLLLVGCSQR